jgi:hypothetical protein
MKNENKTKEEGGGGKRERGGERGPPPFFSFLNSFSRFAFDEDNSASH